jgi:hypothetical protein
MSGINGTAVLARNIKAWNLGADFSNSNKLLINASVDHMRHNGAVHADVVQIPSGIIDNMIIYGLRATDITGQGISIGDLAQPLSNVAVVNGLLQQSTITANYTWIADGSTANHILYWNVTYVNYTWKFNVAGQKNLSIRNCVVPAASINVSLYPGLIADNNHFITGTTFGTHATTGDPGWVNAAAGDYRPTAASILTGRVLTPLVANDLMNQLLGTNCAIGALQPDDPLLPPLP